VSLRADFIDPQQAGTVLAKGQPEWRASLAGGSVVRGL